MLKWENKYFIKSIAIKKEQPIAISCLSICLVVLEDYKNAIKLLTDSIKGWEKPKDKILLLVVKAKLLHWYQMEKKGFKAHYERFKMESSIGNGVSMDDLDDGLSSDEEAYDSDDEVDVEQNQSIQIGRSLTFKKIKTKSKFENRNSIVSENDISFSVSSKSNSLGAIRYIDDAIKIAETNNQKDSNSEISFFLDLHTLKELKSEIMIEMNIEPEQQKIKLSLYSCVLEAERELKFSSDMDAFLKAKSILLKVLEDDSLNFKALLNLAYISICYENNPLEGLDYLLRAKLINPNSHQLWNLLGHAYWFIDGVGDKAEEWFTEASVVQLEHLDWIELTGIIPFVI